MTKAKVYRGAMMIDKQVRIGSIRQQRRHKLFMGELTFFVEQWIAPPIHACRLFDRNPSKRRRLSLLHPETSHVDASYDNSFITLQHTSPSSIRLDYEALAQDFVRACQIGGGSVVNMSCAASRNQ